MIRYTLDILDMIKDIDEHYVLKSDNEIGAYLEAMKFLEHNCLQEELRYDRQEAFAILTAFNTKLGTTSGIVIKGYLKRVI